jgi:hypothetical protein
MTLLCDNKGAWPFTDGWPVLLGVIRSFSPTIDPGDDDEDDDEDDEDDGKEGGNIDPDEDEGYGDDEDDDEEPLRVARPAPPAQPGLLRRSKPFFHGFGTTRLPHRTERPVRILSRRRHTARPQSSAPFRAASPHASVPRHR